MVKVVKNISAPTLFRLMAGLALAIGPGCRRSAPGAEAPARAESAAQETAASTKDVTTPKPAPAASVATAAPVAPEAPATATVPVAQATAAAPAEQAPAAVVPTTSADNTPPPAEAASPAAKEPTVADLRRAFASYDQQLKREDPVCVRLNAEIDAMRQSIASNQAAILDRLQADPEWVRLRSELVGFQRASDARQRQARLLHRAGGTNAPPLVVPRPSPGRPVARGGQP